MASAWQNAEQSEDSDYGVKTEFFHDKKFQIGMIVSIYSLIRLQLYIKEKY